MSIEEEIFRGIPNEKLIEAFVRIAPKMREDPSTMLLISWMLLNRELRRRGIYQSALESLDRKEVKVNRCR